MCLQYELTQRFTAEFSIRAFQRSPTPMLDLLELLKDDPALYVRRSVANNHPERLVETCGRWSRDATPERAWLIRHALRSAVKRGDRGALTLLGAGDAASLTVTGSAISPARAAIGEIVTIMVTVANELPGPRRVMLDLRVHFVKAGGRTSPKVFKGASFELAGGATREVEKRISLAQHTTRTHHPGRHAVDALLNGSPIPMGAFEVV